MKFAVTAASGKLGGAVVQALKTLHGPDAIVGLARTPARAAGLGVEVRPGDYNQPAQLRASLAGVDAVLLVSGMDAPDKRIAQHRNVIDAAREAGAQKLVYTSIQGLEAGTGFSPVVQSNRQTEADIRSSGLDWAIGRNGIYIEPDVAYIDEYRARGEIANCAGEGRCGYTTRVELGQAYAHMLSDDVHNGQTYQLHGPRLSQTELARFLNQAFGTQLVYRPMSVAAYRADRIQALGPFIGGVIAGIYEGISMGALDVESDFAVAAGRPHQRWADYFGGLRASPD